MSGNAVKDLILLAADRQIEAALAALVERPQAISMRPITCDRLVHPQRDPGCRLRAGSLLAPLRDQYRHALVAFDRRGCGVDMSREEIEGDVERQLAQHGWPGGCAAIVIDPELEAWVWSDSPAVDEVLGWRGREPPLRAALQQAGYLASDQCKPADPQGALDWSLRQVRRPRSSAIFARLAQRVGLSRCSDAAFVKLRQTLRAWFPPEPGC